MVGLAEGYEFLDNFLNSQQVNSFNQAVKTLTFSPKSGGILNDDDDKAITKSIIALGKALNLNIIAEGVEDIEQLLQGYLFSKPITADELLSSLKQPHLILNKMEPSKVA